jgi:hypothetical protein
MTTDAQIADITNDLPLETAELMIVKPGTATPTGWVITLAGLSHPKAVAHQRDVTRERLHKQATIEAMQANSRKFKPDEKSVDENEIETMRWVVSRIVTWTPVKIGDETISFSDEAAIALLRRPVMAGYLQQIVDYLNAERSFMPASAKS